MTMTRNWKYTASDLPKLSPFGSVQTDRISISKFANGKWSAPDMIGMDEFTVHPGSHCLHYGSSCFEGLKAYRWDDDSLVVFRIDQHAKRMMKSGELLRLPAPSEELFQQMVFDTVNDAADHIPPAPGALYLRPVLLGGDTNIGAASTASQSAIFYVMASPVGDYFAGGERALRLLIENTPRTAPSFGRVKTGANYAAALGTTIDAKEKWKVDQVLFCPDNDVQETGAANFLLIDDKKIVTKPLHDSFLHGVTRNSVLTFAADMGYAVEERNFTVDELLKWTEHGEAALSGTAAVLAGVGTLIHGDKEYPLSGQETGPNTRRLRKALVEIQQGVAQDTRGWISRIE